jgi:glycine cleavage system H protein
MNIPKNLLYTKTHEWIDFKDDTTAIIGITDFAQGQLGEIVHVNMPPEGEVFAAGDVVAGIESDMAAADMFLPVTGTISAVNERLMDQPDLINTSPYDAWICEVSGIEDKLELISAEEYDAFLQEEASF